MGSGFRSCSGRTSSPRREAIAWPAPGMAPGASTTSSRACPVSLTTRSRGASRSPPTRGCVGWTASARLIAAAGGWRLSESVAQDGRRGHAARQGRRRTCAAAHAIAALNMRLAGASYEDIAHSLGYGDRSGASPAVEGEVKDIPQERAREVVGLEPARLDAVMGGAWERALRGEASAVAAALRIRGRKARCLELNGLPRHFGIDAREADRGSREAPGQVDCAASCGNGPCRERLKR